MHVRRATTDDTDELLRLAAMMFVAVGLDPSSGDWRDAARELVVHGLSEGTVAGFVIDDPSRAGALVASAMASVSQRLSTPTNPDGRVAYVQWVATEPEFRRRGAARAVMNELVAWARANDLAWVDLHASSEGEPLYRSLGFAENRNPELRLRVV